MGDIGEIKLDLPIEPQDRPVKEAAASGGEVVELREYLRIQPRDAIEDSRLDVVHLLEVHELENVIGCRALFELFEIRLDFGPIIGLIMIGRDGDDAVADEQRVANGAKSRGNCCDLLQQVLKGRGADVAVEKGEKADKPRRGGRRRAKIGQQTLDALTIELDGVEQPSLLLVFVVQLARLGEVFPHRSHRVREPRHRVIARIVLEIAHHLLAVFHGFARLERLVEKRRQLVFLLAGGDRGDDLVKVEVGEIGRLLRTSPPCVSCNDGLRMLRKVMAGSLRPRNEFDPQPAPRRADRADERRVVRL